ncbi:Rho GTPase activating protein with PAK-box/P21-Rho-binding domain [Hibiscus syriacus]|uniref:Rho GTPase activating protein with PAK-box/P21-Rho-binding domain n=1 Tax=Hibiscus syriacus TaxID=106335 RepID=A0A6A3CUU2_HIBSY|nr:protein FANTASTIC FOUR 1-like [Hibiscus syriacus]KAE8733053.1 Rho GTPase activating protein with PAK-box/P21-Rho-binding domain [Hibiscus syriacus]
MAVCGSIHHIFENPSPENPTLLESLSSWNQIKPVEQPAFTEIFGELHFKENICVPQSSSSHENYEKSEGFSWSSESLQLCTEGLGFESSGDVEDMKQEWENKTMTTTIKHSMENLYGELKRSRGSGGGGGFPPPISCIGKSGKPCFCFKSYREDGRFVLEQVRVPTQEFLHACREDGRLKLRFVQPNDDEVLEDEEFEEEDEGGAAQKQDS